MNKWIGIGRLTKEPEIKNTSNQIPVCRFTLAIDRKFKNSNGEKETDFINCVAWRQTATFISSYFHKGNRIAVVGSIQTRSFDGDDGKKVYVTEAIIDEAEFVESASSAAESAPTKSESAPTKPKNDDVEGDLPFPIDDDDPNEVMEF